MDDQLLATYRAMRTARTTNAIEAELASGGDSFFHLPTTGHESVAAWNAFLTPDDWIHTHYRDQALWIARGIPPKAVFDAALCNADNYSSGRQMVGFQASRKLNMPSTVVPVANNCTQAVGIAAHLEEQRKLGKNDSNPVVLCGMGDGTTQQGEVYEAIADAVRRHLPVLFYIMDNGYAISTPTHQQTFFDRPEGPADEFYGLPIHRFDGRDVMPEMPRMGALVDHVRNSRGPAIAIVRVDRLSSHTNADDHRVYRAAETIEELKNTSDPLANFRRSMIERGFDEAKLDAIDAELEKEIRHVSELSRRVGDPETTYTVSRELPAKLQRDADEYRGESNAKSNGSDSLMMIEAMRETLRHRLDTDDNVVLLGEDIEDPKGDVFGVTRGLSTAFPGRVQNTALTESTIIGGAIGRAMAGGRPVGFIQFADFLPNGISQIISELGSIYWRSGGEFECPVILMVTCGAYRPGLGPFHANTYESMLAHIPGVDVVMPSTAGDAAGLLNAAFESKRPTIFLYPKVCLNDRALATSPDVDKQLVPLGKARLETQGDDLTLVGWGSTMPIVRDVAAEITKQTSRTVDLFDLRSIDPWDRPGIAASAAKTGRLLVVHEDNLTVGFGAEIVAAVTEDVSNADPGMRAAARMDLKVKRITRPDTYVPTNYKNQLEILPSFRRTLTAACELLDLTVDFGTTSEAAASVGGGEIETIEAQGSAPTDQAVTVVQWLCKPGEAVTNGQVIAELEADKAIFEYSAPYDAVVAELLLPEGEQVDVGTPMLKLEKPTLAADADLDDPLSAPVVKRPAREDRGTPTITDPTGVPTSVGMEPTHKTPGVAPVRVGGRQVRVYLSPVHYAEGTDRLTNADLIRRFPDYTSDDIIKRTGIESRPYCSHKQNALSMAIDAAQKALAAEGLTVHDLTGIVCHTTTPPLNTPSMACMVLNALDPTGDAELMVYDVNAACSGWLYALDAAHNTIQHNPDSAVLVVTTECLSRVVNPDDFGTAILFGDAATATVARGAVAPGSGPAKDEDFDIPAGSMMLSQPVLAGKADPAHAITVGFEGRGHITMQGKRVFTEAVRAMTKMTNQAFERSGAALEDLDWLVPHQANARILEAARIRLKIPKEKIINLIDVHGNTSSSSIPISIAKSTEKFEPGNIVGVCAFGGGFTFGAAILEIV
ncbi:beta-ketoacyl-ACP synthase 3 [Algisphaera agarilytica]|uniref:3-methyl-2-oxobutanoate dehydrogenase (2-methylpropanoyl-transferring) n=1 Tax=Algisphaera agarilytica TaxID=1385975 RepID=A0A7X0H7E5_9BACT|nr:beta-ketoacyl-ACP synthase 3 [Algisphaera agarilytica]MBB6430662.1 2-oxoisovalerate dehydrogenase E1 component [Algisphaera agarilytica]